MVQTVPRQVASLRIVAGGKPGEEFPLDALATKSRLTFGRQDSCDFVLDHGTVSREHFCVERVAGKLLIVDGRSGNGTFVNGDRINWVELHVGDRVQAGPFVMVAVPFGREAGELEPPVGNDNEIGVLHSACDSTTASPSGGQEGPVAGHQLIYPRKYLEGIELFNARRYYDAHEVWEEIWLRAEGQEKLFYQLLIQIAVALHHYERGNSLGVRGTYRRAAAKFSSLPGTFMSVDLAGFDREVKEFFQETIEDDQPRLPDPSRPRPRITLIMGYSDV
ncbi:MAG TPA: DUF309 domain-containing protein [Blastocatellia bacterium]|nr:DUF309 domain-containing protein [Blastocatellia bacterium]